MNQKEREAINDTLQAASSQLTEAFEATLKCDWDKLEGTLANTIQALSVTLDYVRGRNHPEDSHGLYR